MREEEAWVYAKTDPSESYEVNTRRGGGGKAGPSMTHQMKKRGI